MVHFNNKSGFSLLETIIAMLIMSVMAMPLVVMQGNSLRRTVHDARRLERIFLMHNFLYEARSKTPPGATTFTFPDQKNHMQYQLMPPAANSALHAMKGIHIERVTATWYEFGKQKQETLVTTTYIEPEAPKE